MLARLRDGNIAAGAGYSTDSQQVAPQICYNATVSSISGQSGSLELDTAQSFVDIQNEVRQSVSVKGGIGMFSASAETSYLQSMEDKDYSMSLNYYYYSYATAAVQLAGFGVNALTESGQGFYDNGNNPYFGLICGDQYITSYDEGAMLLMGVNIQFSSNYEKEQFTAHAGASFGDIFSASGDIQKIASTYGISGSVVMQAFQIGGDPSQLSYILNKDGNGNYYVLTCSLEAMSNCISAASGMLDYAKYNFTTQFSFENNTGLTPLGTGFMAYEPIYYIGLTPPPSLVTPNVTEDRLTLANALLENQYYEQKFYQFLYGYPVVWNTTSSIYLSAQALFQKAQGNVAVLMSPSNPEAGGLGCFTFPDQCDTLTKTIQGNLVPINASDLNFFGEAKYILPSEFGPYYFFGSGYNIYPIQVGTNGDTFNDLIAVDITDSYFYFALHYRAGGTGDGKIWTQCGNETSTDGMDYQGIVTQTFGYSCGSSQTYHGTWSKTISPFYFEAYNGTNQGAEVIGQTPEQDVVGI
jgi:hypothetical protein